MTSDRWRRSEALYHAALARPKAERSVFLAEACADDETMRRDVESLLEQLTSDDAFLCEPPHVTADHIGGEPEPIAMAGRTLGSYHLRDLLGAGGMGEVYRARDATLNRDVAIKILPRAFTSSPARLARFEREAQILASLNHPHICAIYGLDEVDGLRFLVLELVEGKTLAHTLAAAARRSERGRMGLEDALTVARQIAAAFEAAHERGIVHRDLKPANVIITPDGVAKVLDFGLAKTSAGDGVPDDHEPVGEADATLAGTVIGTAAYMSPEQASGKAVDRRTDVWAFGVVLFEMVSGHRPFAGTTVPELLAAVVKDEPDWSALPAATPPDLRRLLRQCLHKDPKRRLQSMGDARIQIEDLQSGASDQSVINPRPRRLVLRWLVAATVALGLAVVVVWRQQPVAQPVTRLGLALPSGQQLDGSGGGHIVALSPDGGRIAFIASPPAIYLRSLSSDEVNAIPGTEGHGSVREPVFSPDGREIAFFASADRTLKRIAVDGSRVAVTICPATTPYGMSWGADGIVFGQGPDGIMRVSPDGGAPQQLVRVAQDEYAHGPQLLPGGKHVLFTLATGSGADRWDKAQIVVQSLSSGERTTLYAGGSDARYVPSGHVIYAVGGRVFAAALDERSLSFVGDPVPIVEGVRRSAGNWSGAANTSISNNGSLIYVPGPVAAPNSLMDLAIVDRQTGEVRVLDLPPRRYASPRVSPDGRRLAYAIEDGIEAAVWTYELSGTMQPKRLTMGGNNRFPIWTSSTSLAYQSDRDGDRAIFRQSIGGNAERVTRPDTGVTHTPESWSERTNTLLFSSVKGTDVSLWALSLHDGRSALFTAVSASSAHYATGAVFSPDGQWVAYGSAPRRATTIYVEPFPANGVKHQLAPRGTDGPHEPVWSPDGKELFYNPRLGGFEAVSVTTHPTFAFGNNPVPLVRKLQMGPPGAPTNYDVTRDGDFVGMVPTGRTEYDDGADDRINVVLNWLEDVKAQLGRH